MSSKSTFRSFAKTARERRLSGTHYDQNSEFPLTGYCFDNAFVLYQVLVENGYNPSIVAGLSEEYAESLLREVSVEELNTVHDLAGSVHFWVECSGYVIDIAPMIEQSYGEIYIDSNLPESYHRLNDSYEYAENTRISAVPNRCDFCGGSVNNCGCKSD